MLEKKGEIEKAFALDDRLSGRLDDSGEGTLERPARRNPLPPPRIDSYNRKGRKGLSLYLNLKILTLNKYTR